MVKLSLRNLLQLCNRTNAFYCHFWKKKEKNIIQSIVKSRKDLGALDQCILFTDNNKEQKGKDCKAINKSLNEKNHRKTINLSVVKNIPLKPKRQ